MIYIYIYIYILYIYIFIYIYIYIYIYTENYIQPNHIYQKNQQHMVRIKFPYYVNSLIVYLLDNHLNVVFGASIYFPFLIFLIIGLCNSFANYWISETKLL